MDKTTGKIGIIGRKPKVLIQPAPPGKPAKEKAEERRLRREQASLEAERGRKG